jgi:hypothetical protein
VLRSAASVRPVLEWMERSGSTLGTEKRRPDVPRLRMEFTDGARRAASASNIASSPATAVAYNQKLGGTSSLLFAGQMSYDDDAPGGGIATVWLPTGTLGAGPHTALVLRQAKIGPGGPNFHGARLDQGGAISLGNRLLLRYGGEYVVVGLGASASSLRPRAELNYQISQDWSTALIFASMPSGPGPLETAATPSNAMLTAALNELDAFPALLMRDGRPVLQNGWHEEFSAHFERNWKVIPSSPRFIPSRAPWLLRMTRRACCETCCRPFRGIRWALPFRPPCLISAPSCTRATNG